jgi:hypothetical protein
MRRTKPFAAAVVLVATCAAFGIAASPAAAATCTYSANGNWTTGGSCGSTPASTDTAVIDSGITVTVDADHSIAGITMNGGTITFSGSNPTLSDTGPFSSTSSDTLIGNGTLSVAGTETHSSSQLTIENSADLVLNSTGGISGGDICLLGSTGGTTTDDPSLQINGTFTLGSGADSVPFSCNTGIDSAAIQVGGTGTIVDARPGTTSIGTPMQVAQGGLLHVTAGALQLVGGSKGATDDGRWSIDAGTTLGVNDSFSGTTLGPHSAIDGAGTLDVEGALTVPSGATFTISNLTLGGTVTLDDNAAAYTPAAITLGGTLAGDRDVTPGSLVDTAGGALTGPFTTTIGAAATFTLSSQLAVEDRARLVFNRDLTLGAGADFCLLGTGPGTADDPSILVNGTLTIGSAAPATPIACNSGLDSPAFLVGSAGALVDARPGATAIVPAIGNAGTVSVGNGQTLNTSGYDQSGGTTTVASGGTFGGNMTLTGGALSGGGTLTGSLVNTAGSVRPGASPGILTVNGDYSQGPGGTLQVEINGTTPGTQYDQLAVGGNASLDGTLAIVTGGGFDPALTDTFDVLTATGTVSGAFGTLTGAQLAGKAYSAQYTAGAPGQVTLALSPTATAPVNQTAPSIPSSAHPADTVTCNPGNWTGSPAFAFAWLRDGVQITTGSSYTVTAGDVGHSLVCRVTATSARGSTNAASNSLVPTAVVVPIAAPANTAPPSIPAAAGVGDALVCTPGTWTGSPAFAFRWLRDGAPVAGATGQFFVVGSGDVGHVLSCRVTATNAGGSASATSNTVTPQAPPVTIAGLPADQGCVPGGLSLGVRVLSAGLKRVVALLDGKPIFTSHNAHFRLAIPKGEISAGRHRLRIHGSYRAGMVNKSFSFVKCRGGGRSPRIEVGGVPSRTACRATPFTFHAVVIGTLPKSIRVTLDGKPVTKPGKLRFRVSIDVPALAAGQHEVLIVATDRFGNSGRFAIDFLHC